MRVRPTGAELLATARTVLRERLLPHASGDDRQALCGIARTMAVAAHELEFEQPPKHDDLEMLESARTLLREQLLTRLPEDRRYDARLVAKAMAVAAAELTGGDAFERAELARLGELLDEPQQPAGMAPDVRAQLAKLSARLCSEIRSGGLDPGTPRGAAAYAHLRETTRAALRVSNPAYVKAHAGSARNGQPAK